MNQRKKQQAMKLASLVCLRKKDALDQAWSLKLYLKNTAFSEYLFGVRRELTQRWTGNGRTVYKYILEIPNSYSNLGISLRTEASHWFTLHTPHKDCFPLWQPEEPVIDAELRSRWSLQAIEEFKGLTNIKRADVLELLMVDLLLTFDQAMTRNKTFTRIESNKSI